MGHRFQTTTSYALFFPAESAETPSFCSPSHTAFASGDSTRLNTLDNLGFYAAARSLVTCVIEKGVLFGALGFDMCFRINGNSIMKKEYFGGRSEITRRYYFAESNDVLLPPKKARENGISFDIYPSSDSLNPNSFDLFVRDTSGSKVYKYSHYPKVSFLRKDRTQHVYPVEAQDHVVDRYDGSTRSAVKLVFAPL
jgi:hypothetical protein